MDEFKSVELIEFHDSGFLVHPEKYSEPMVSWSEYLDEGASYSLIGKSIELLCNCLDVPLQKQIKHHNFPILRRDQIVVGHKQDGRWIEQLAARIIDRDLLEILVKWGFDGEAEPQFEEARVTYHGTFTVWWEESSW